MFKQALALLAAGTAFSVSAAQISFDFAHDTVGQAPPEFASLVTGAGLPARWKIVEVAVPPLLAPIESNAVVNTERAALTVQSPNLDEGHYPILLFTNEIFGDFTYATRFKIDGGVISPAAGLVFRAQDQSNYYVLRASTEGNLLWYRVVDGKSYQSLGIGVKVPISQGAWRELRVECSGSQIRCYLDGELAIPPVKPGSPTNGVAINDTTFSHGKVGFWTQADSKCYFVDARVQYTPRVPYVQIVINNITSKYSRLLDLKVYAGKNGSIPAVIGSMNEKGLGDAGTKAEAAVIDHGSIFYLKAAGAVEITLPLRDRNGEIVAALKVRMKSFRGETQATAVARATLVKKAVEEQLETLQDING